MVSEYIGTSESEQVNKLYGVRLNKDGQFFFFPANNFDLHTGTKVLVEIDQGVALGEVVALYDFAKASSMEELISQGGRILSTATAKDIALDAENSLLAAEAAAYCKTCIRLRSLDMKLIEVTVLHDRSKIIFFFTAPTRIDFRELVKDLVRNYRTRIELRQIGVRHETQMLGGIGNCGRVCCCHGYLRKFAPVTIKMAKEQNLFLNPAKLSGLCGRLLCCLSFEQSNYEEFNRRCPKLGKRYSVSSGMLIKVIRTNMFKQTIIALPEMGEEQEYSIDEWEALDPRRCDKIETKHHERTEQLVKHAPGQSRHTRDENKEQMPRNGKKRIFKKQPVDELDNELKALEDDDVSTAK